jgi:hypothetical protein
MAWSSILGKLGATIGTAVWWTLVAPFCLATDLSRLGASKARPLRLSGAPDSYPVTELLGRLQWFRGRVRLARALLIVFRAIVLCALLLLVAKIYETSLDHPLTAWLPLILFFVVGWAVHLSLHHAITPFEVARMVDRRMKLDAQVATAVEYTLSDRLDRPLARTQVRFATNRLRELEPHDVIPLVVPGRDIRVLAFIGVAYAAVAYAGTLGLNLPKPLRSLDAELAKQSSLEAQAPSPYTTIDPSRMQFQQATALNPASSQSPVQDQLNALKQQLASNQITDAQYEQQVQKVQQQVAAKAAESLQAQQSLSSLASALKDTAATDAVSNSLSQGNYQQASQQLSDLSKQIGQMSQDSRAQLADQLANAAAQSQQSNPTLARDASEASNALKQGDTQGASNALQDLAQSVQQTSSQIADQSQLGQDMQQVQQDLNQGQNGSNSSGQNAGNGSPSGTDQANGGLGSQTDPTGSGAQSSAVREAAGTGGQAGQDGSPADGAGQAATRSTSGEIQADSAGGGSGAGNGPGGSPLGAGSSLSVQGVRLTILGRPSSPSAAPASPGDRSVPLTSAGGSSLNGLASSGTVPSNVPINVHQESNVVPLDRQPVVREYFSNGSNGN